MCSNISYGNLQLLQTNEGILFLLNKEIHKIWRHSGEHKILFEKIKQNNPKVLGKNIWQINFTNNLPGIIESVLIKNFSSFDNRCFGTLTVTKLVLIRCKYKRFQFASIFSPTLKTAEIEFHKTHHDVHIFLVHTDIVKSKFSGN